MRPWESTSDPLGAPAFSPAREWSAGLDGRDAGVAIPGMAAHLVGCPACQEDYESLRALVGGEQAR